MSCLSSASLQVNISNQNNFKPTVMQFIRKVPLVIFSGILISYGYGTEAAH